MRQFFATLDRPCSRTEDELTHLGEGVLAEEADAQRRYDEETANGRDGTGQSRWERQVNGMLKELASFAQFLAFCYRRVIPRAITKSEVPQCGISTGVF